MNPIAMANLNFRGGYLISGQTLLECSGFDFAHLERQPAIYEVLRVMESVPLFLEQHIGRMNKSALLAGLKITFSIDQVSHAIRKLASANSIAAGNVKLVFPISLNTVAEAMLAYFIPHSYPTPAMYSEGVEMLSLKAGRPNPNAKITNLSLRQKANQLIADNDIYEVLLINEQELITEGSRSNIFFIHDDTVITPPENLVLPGITRNYVIEICHKNQIPFAERNIRYPELGSLSAAFLTGTSPKVLPVRRIDGVEFSTEHPLLSRLINLYDEQIKIYIRKNIFRSG